MHGSLNCTHSESQLPKTCAWHQALTSVHVQDDLAEMEMVLIWRWCSLQEKRTGCW